MDVSILPDLRHLAGADDASDARDTRDADDAGANADAVEEVTNSRFFHSNRFSILAAMSENNNKNGGVSDNDGKKGGINDNGYDNNNDGDYGSRDGDGGNNDWGDGDGSDTTNDKDDNDLTNGNDNNSCNDHDSDNGEYGDDGDESGPNQGSDGNGKVSIDGSSGTVDGSNEREFQCVKFIRDHWCEKLYKISDHMDDIRMHYPTVVQKYCPICIYKNKVSPIRKTVF